jgi:leucyl aminopeptidase (aminopeptidase T)
MTGDHRQALRDRSAEATVACLGVASTDDVLLVCNQPQRAIAEAIAATARRIAGSVRIVEYPVGTRHGEEPPAGVADAMAQATVIIAPTSFSLSHSQARLDATRRGARVATMPTITDDIFARALAVDYRQLARSSQRIAAQLTKASRCRITSPAGTEVQLDLTGRAGRSDDGNLGTPGAFGNLPAGEAYIAPLETRGDGTIMYDGSLAGFGLLEQPLRVTLEAGCAVAASGEAGEWLLQTLDAGGPTGCQIAEIGIGTNPAATLTGNILEDEKVIGTMHLAFGASISLGGANRSGVHIDGLLRLPTVTLDSELLSLDGRPP